MSDKVHNIDDYLIAGLKTASMRGAVIANNIANLETPGYRRRDVEFETMLASAMSRGKEIDLDDIQPRIFQPMNTQVNSSGNDVNIELEVGQMIKNSARYKTYMRLLSKLYSQMQLAIQSD